MGGTCALDLTTMHPEKFSTFVDIAGDLGPNAGTRAQTIARLFGGSLEVWAAFDPATVITKQGRYSGVSGWFAVNGSAETSDAGGQLAAARSLCALGRRNGIDCAVVTEPGRHDWPFAGQAFATALPWLAGRLNTPGVFPAAPVRATAAGPTMTSVHPGGKVIVDHRPAPRRRTAGVPGGRHRDRHSGGDDADHGLLGLRVRYFDRRR